MTADPVLSAAEQDAAEALLSDAWGGHVQVCTAEVVWERAHVVRLTSRDGRSAILKRARQHSGTEPEPEREGFGNELASLEFLSGMPVAVAPRLVGADVATGILVMEELPAGQSLSDSLLFGDRAAAVAGFAAYATALGRVHAWSMSRTGDYARLLARYSPDADPRPWLLQRIEEFSGQFLRVAASLGVASDGAAADIDELIRTLSEPRYLGFVHCDLCPDNVRLVDGQMRIFDFEESCLGSVAIDASYLLAPFPSCWCFGSVPADVADPAMQAYLVALRAGGIEAGNDLDTELSAALAGWMVARGRVIERTLRDDREWGTTTMRPRLLAWTDCFATTAAADVFPRLRLVAQHLHDRLRTLWPDAAVPEYPALAHPSSRATITPPRQPTHRPLARVSGLGWVARVFCLSSPLS